MSETTVAAPLLNTVPAPKPGLYEAVPYERYAQWDAANHSFLCHFGRSAAHAREEMLNPSQSTEAKDLGHAVHLAILEPERFEKSCVVRPNLGARRSKKVKEAYAAFEEAHRDSEILSGQQMEKCKRMRDAVWAHPTARELLGGAGINEACLVWKDEQTELPCKARVDRIASLWDWPVFVDAKSSRNASRRAFERDLYNFRYHEQAGFYLTGGEALAPMDRKFVFIVVENEPPYCVAVYELEQDAIDLGRDEAQKHLRMYADCLQTGNWPAYGDGCDYVSVPPWAFKAIDGGGD